jgi:hypothetical protein
MFDFFNERNKAPSKCESWGHAWIIEEKMVTETNTQETDVPRRKKVKVRVCYMCGEIDNSRTK